MTSQHCVISQLKGDSTIRVPHRRDKPHLGRQQGILGWESQSGLEETTLTRQRAGSAAEWSVIGETFTRAYRAAFRGDQQGGVLQRPAEMTDPIIMTSHSYRLLSSTSPYSIILSGICWRSTLWRDTARTCRETLDGSLGELCELTAKKKRVGVRWWGRRAGHLGLGM